MLSAQQGRDTESQLRFARPQSPSGNDEQHCGTAFLIPVDANTDLNNS